MSAFSTLCMVVGYAVVGCIVTYLVVCAVCAVIAWIVIMGLVTYGWCTRTNRPKAIKVLFPDHVVMWSIFGTIMSAIIGPALLWAFFLTNTLAWIVVALYYRDHILNRKEN